MEPTLSREYLTGGSKVSLATLRTLEHSSYHMESTVRMKWNAYGYSCSKAPTLALEDTMDDDPLYLIVVTVGIIIVLSLLSYCGIGPAGHRYM